MLRPGLPVGEFNKTVVDYLRREGLWERRGWIWRLQNGNRLSSRLGWKFRV